MKKVIYSAATALVVFASLSAPAIAASFTVSPGSFSAAVPGNNDFKGQLAGLGLGSYTSTGASIFLATPRTLRFEFLGSESGANNFFTANGITSFQEVDSNNFGAPVLIGQGVFTNAQFQSIFFNSGSASNVLTNAMIGDARFGIFMPGNGTDSDSLFNSNVLHFGFDDMINNNDDNHDDFLVRVSAVPEPSTWLSMIMGFGLLGVMARRRRAANSQLSVLS